MSIKAYCNHYSIFVEEMWSGSSIYILDFKMIVVEERVIKVERPVRILDKKEQILRDKIISLVKILWQNHDMEEGTWESEDDMRCKYLQLFKG